MTDVEFLLMLKTAFKDHLNADKSNSPSLQQLLELVEFFRQEVIEDYKLKKQINDDIRSTKTATLDEI